LKSKKKDKNVENLPEELINEIFGKISFPFLIKVLNAVNFQGPQLAELALKIEDLRAEETSQLRLLETRRLTIITFTLSFPFTTLINALLAFVRGHLHILSRYYCRQHQIYFIFINTHCTFTTSSHLFVIIMFAFLIVGMS